MDKSHETEYHRDYCRKWRLENPEKARNCNRRYNQKKKLAEKELEKDIFEQYFKKLKNTL